MIYTVILQDRSVFYTNWFDYENNWNDEFHFLVINNISHQYSNNGKDWIDIQDDHL